MVNRVLLDTGLKVSQPGVDVLSANPLQLLFNSDWSGLGVVQSGTWTAPWPGGSTMDVGGFINFTKTFSSIPFCAFFLVRGGYMSPLGYGNGFFTSVRNSDSGTQSRSALLAQVSTTGIQFRAMLYRVSNPGLVNVDYTVRYFVFDRNT